MFFASWPFTEATTQPCIVKDQAEASIIHPTDGGDGVNASFPFKPPCAHPTSQWCATGDVKLACNPHACTLHSHWNSVCRKIRDQSVECRLLRCRFRPATRLNTGHESLALRVPRVAGLLLHLAEMMSWWHSPSYTTVHISCHCRSDAT